MLKTIHKTVSPFCYKRFHS